MANQNKPSGLTPVRYLNGADWSGQANWYYIDNTDGNAYYVGDLVITAAGLDGVAGLPTINPATAGGASCGVAIAFGASANTTSSNRGGPLIDPTNLTLVNVPATKTKNYFALVVDDPQVIFEAQETNTSTLTKTATSKNVNVVVAAPATGVAVSGTYISGTTVATTATLNLKLMGLAQKYDPGSASWNTFGAWAKWLCLINNHQYSRGTGSLGT